GMLALGLPERDAAGEPGHVGDELDARGKGERHLLRVPAADIEPVEIEERVEGADRLGEAPVPLLLASLLESLRPELLFVGLPAPGGVMGELHVRDEVTADEEGRAEARAQRDHELDAAAADDAEA